jgi:tetratricopeptide (TPR) repeat protein
MSVQRRELALRRAQRSWTVATVLGILCLALPLTASSAGCTLAKLAELPVTMLNLQPVVSVKINGADARLIADSDAFYSFLDASDRRFSIGEEYMLAGQMSPAIAQFDLWIHAHPQDLKLGTAFDYRCRARALSGQDLDKALDDCNAALRMSPNAAPFLDSRALVRLRRGDYRKSIADYDAALGLRPKFAWSLYCRGVAHIRLGNSSEGQADIAAATALRPQIAAETGKYGIAP